MANQFKDYLYNNLSEDLINEWTIYIFPTLNPDGQYDGWTNNGPVQQFIVMRQIIKG